MNKYVRIHLAGLTDRVVRLRLLKITELQQVQTLANQKASRTAVEGGELTLQMLAQVVTRIEVLEGLKLMICGVSAMPVTLVEPAPQEPNDDGEVPVQMPRAVVDGRLRLVRAGADGLAHMDARDWVPITLRDLEFPGAKNLDELFDAREYSVLSNAYHSLHGAPIKLVQEMLAGKLNPVAMED